MRNILLALVLANLAFAAWHAWFADARSTVPPPRADTPGLTLVSELPPDVAALTDVPSSEAPAGGPDTELSADRCVSVGPFRELAQAAGAAASLRAAGYSPVQRVAEDDVWIGYWVYIEGLRNATEANEVLAKVRERSVADAYVIPNNDSGNLVSLGVFSEIGGVTRLRDEVRGLGYEPTVVDRTRRATVYWIDVTLGADQSIDFDTLQPPGRIIRLEQQPCERLAE